MNIIAFCHGNPFDQHSWSGSNRGLFSALDSLGILADAVDVEPRGRQRYLLAAREFSFRRRAWRQNFLKSPLTFAARSARAAQFLRGCAQPPYAILQTGAMFDANSEHPDIPRFCYLDSTCALSARGGEQSFSYHARADYKAIARANERRIYAASAGIFVFSNFVRRSLIDDFDVPPERIHVVYAGINMPHPAPERERRCDPIILFVGKDFERKGGPMLLRAFARVHRQCANARLVIAGCAPRIKQPGVEVLGFIDKRTPDGIARLASLYHRASVFTLPSHYEPFGIVYAEAMHHGLPCVGVNHCAIPEIISDGETGLLVPPDDEEALAQALLFVIQNPREAQRMGESGARRAQALFDWNIVTSKMRAVMERARQRPAAVQAA